MKSIGRLSTSLAARLVRPVRAAAAWRWGAPIARAAVAALGLVVLAAIGRSALAGGATKSLEATADPAPDSLPRAPAVAVPVTPIAPVAAKVAEVPPVGASPDAGEAPARGRATPDDPVFLNQATLADLRRLPGVGAKKAQAILALRDRLQHFRQIEDLLKVKGIGRASLKKLRPLVRLDLLASPPTPASGGGGATPPPP